MSLNFKKPLLMPSSHALGYNSLAWLSSLGHNFQLYQQSSSYDSVFEFFLTIIKHHVELSIDLQQLYLQDFYFLISYIFTTDLFINDDYINIDYCVNCHEKNEIIIDFGSVGFIPIIPWVYKHKLNHTINFNNISITMRHRIVQDNIDLGMLLLHYQSNSHIINRILYLLPQIIEIKSSNNTIINKEQYFDFLLNMRMYDIKYCYEYSLKMLSEFGFNNKILYKCLHCNTVNDTQLYDNINLSLIQPTKMNIFKFEDTLKHILELVRLPIFQLSDLKDIPLKYGEQLPSIIKSMKFLKGETIA